MKLLVRSARAGATIAAFAALVLGASASPALASSCSGWSCHGHDPSIYGCSATSTGQADVKDSDGAVVATLQNRYSSGCNANWARAWLTQTGLSRGYMFQTWITTTDSQGHSESMCFPSSLNNSGQLTESCSGYYGKDTQVTWTDMVDGTNLTTANITVVNDAGRVLPTVWVKM